MYGNHTGERIHGKYTFEWCISGVRRIFCRTVSLSLFMRCLGYRIENSIGRLKSGEHSCLAFN